jgi:hypothetical protein
VSDGLGAQEEEEEEPLVDEELAATLEDFWGAGNAPKPTTPAAMSDVGTDASSAVSVGDIGAMMYGDAMMYGAPPQSPSASISSSPRAGGSRRGARGKSRPASRQSSRGSSRGSVGSSVSSRPRTVSRGGDGSANMSAGAGGGGRLRSRGSEKRKTATAAAAGGRPRRKADTGGQRPSVAEEESAAKQLPKLCRDLARAKAQLRRLTTAQVRERAPLAPPNAFLPNAFLPNAFLPNGFLPNGFLPNWGWRALRRRSKGRSTCSRSGHGARRPRGLPPCCTRGSTP